MQSLSLVKNSIKEPKYTFVMAQLQPIPSFLFQFLRKVSQQSFFLLTDLCTINAEKSCKTAFKRVSLFTLPDLSSGKLLRNQHSSLKPVTKIVTRT